MKELYHFNIKGRANHYTCRIFLGLCEPTSLRRRQSDLNTLKFLCHNFGQATSKWSQAMSNPKICGVEIPRPWSFCRYANRDRLISNKYTACEPLRRQTKNKQTSAFSCNIFLFTTYLLSSKAKNIDKIR